MSIAQYQTGKDTPTQDSFEREFPMARWWPMRPGGAGIASVGGLGIFPDHQAMDNFPIAGGDNWEHIMYRLGGDDSPMISIGTFGFAPVSWKTDWYVQDNQQNKQWLAHYEQGAKGRTAFLGVLAGAESWHLEHNIFIEFVFPGLSGWEMNRSRNHKNGPGLMVSFADNVLASVAGHFKLEKVDTHTLYHPIVRGAPTMTGFGNEVVLPALANLSGTPESLSERLYIGDEMMRFCATNWDRAWNWAEQTIFQGITERENGTTSTGSTPRVSDPFNQAPQDEGPPPRDYEEIGPPPDFSDIPF